MKCPDCGTEMTHGETSEGLPYEDCPKCEAWWIDDDGELTDEYGDYPTSLRENYAAALEELAELVCDLSPEGEQAYRTQERECKRLRDLVFTDQRLQ